MTSQTQFASASLLKFGKKWLAIGWLIGVIILLPGYQSSTTKPAPTLTRKADVIIYGGTSAAVTAAVQVKKMGKSVIIVSPDKHLGGLSSGGLGFTDTGNKEVIGGLSREF